MSAATKALDKLFARSTSIGMDVAISIGLGVVAGLGADWLQLDAFPIGGKYVPFAIAGVVPAVVYLRQRGNLLKAPPAFTTPT